MPAVALGHIRTVHGAYRDTGPAAVGAGPEFAVAGPAAAGPAEELQMKRESLAGQCPAALFHGEAEDSLRNHFPLGWPGDLAEAWIRELAEAPQGLDADLH